jgi:2-(1,2-epoxy-1,2-dihydrophenyl)acetyl-CoA isomerase
VSAPELVIDRPEPGVVVLTLNRPERLNAVTLELQRALDATLSALAADGETRCVVLTGAGERAFCAGYDVHEMAEWSADELMLRMLEREPLVWNVAACELPLVAALNGVTYGLGAIIATAVDVRIGCPDTVWRFTSGQHGGANATWSLPALVGLGRAGELLMTGRKIDAGEAERIGLLNRVVARTELLSEAVATASAIAANPPVGMRAIKRLLREHVGHTTEQAFVAENIAMRTELRPRPISELYEDFLKPDA